MIIEGGKHASGRNLARYLLRPGSKAELIDIRGSTGTLGQALTDWETIARTLTKGRRVLYHTYARLPAGERLTPLQWQQVAAQLEENLGLQNCPRALVMHDEGQAGKHLHMVWSRLRPDESLAPLNHDRCQFHAVARWAEAEFNLTPIAAKPERTKALRDRDIKALKGRGLAADGLQKILMKAWNTTTDGSGFRQALDDQDILILKGDRRDYVIEVDGFKMNPVRLMPGVTAAEFRARLEGLTVLRGTPEAQQIRGRKARQLARGQIDRHLANDESAKPVKSGFTRQNKAHKQQDVLLFHIKDRFDVHP